MNPIHTPTETSIRASTVCTLAIACMLLIPQAHLAAAEPEVVTEIKPLLMRAAAQGTASGTLIGTGATYLQRRFDSTEPIDIDVKRLRTLDAPGCGRLEVTTRQRGVLLNGRRQPQELIYQLSFCTDGRFPEER